MIGAVEADAQGPMATGRGGSGVERSSPQTGKDAASSCGEAAEFVDPAFEIHDPLIS